MTQPTLFIKNSKKLLVLAALLLVGSSLAVSPGVATETASAQVNACSSLSDTYGKETYTVTNLPSTTTPYNVWARIKASGEASFVISIDGAGGKLCDQRIAKASNNSYVWQKASGTLAWSGGQARVQLAGDKDNVYLDCVVLHASSTFAPTSAEDCNQTNVAPTPIPAKLQAEEATVGPNAGTTNCTADMPIKIVAANQATNSADGGYVGCWNNVGSYVRFNVSVATAGEYRLVMRYKQPQSANVTRTLNVDGVGQTVDFPLCQCTWFDANWSTVEAEVTLSQGNHTVEVVRPNNSGPIDLDWVDFIQNIEPTPSPPATPVVNAPANGSSFTDTTPTFSGTGENGATVSVKKGSTELCNAAVTAAGQWQCTSSALAVGAHTVSVTQSNFNGTSPTQSLSFTITSTAPPVDTQKPVIGQIQIQGLPSAPSDNAIVTSLTNISITVNATDNVGVASVAVYVNGQQINPVSGRYSTPNKNGDYTFRIVVRDAAGNESEKQYPLRLRHANIDRSGTVNIVDLAMVARDWGKASTETDFNGDGTVNIVDLAYVASKWGQ